ncbi:winged helix-turn-helix transcriptional regulator [Plantactinospora sp. ZYX-F-223]|uniref:Lrp/AsnC family transcriptional regulator n=1 Tax=Plantactinospora sp. ZYX-F-223 TaxID=3144103 RepID=UPI0031FDA33A
MSSRTKPGSPASTAACTSETSVCAELARLVAMSPSAVTERVRRLEEAGVVAGYRAVVVPERIGLDMVAGRIAGLGSVTTSVDYSSPLPGRDLTAEATTPQSVAN